MRIPNPRVRTIGLWCVLGGMCLPTLVFAQSVPANRPLVVSFAHDGVNVAGYRLKLDGAAQPDIAVSQLLKGTVSTQIAGQPEGTHTIAACAFNAAGESCSAAVSFEVFGPPTAPSNITIVVALQQQADGKWNLVVKSVDAQ